MDPRIERILLKVQKPARYTGGEYGQIMKDKTKVSTRFALCFPDTYEIGMSNLGIKILYGVLNNLDGVWCERVFEPWRDMGDAMRESGIPLFALESGDPIKDFDIIGFSLGYEMSYLGMLDMLDLAGIPLHSSERTELSPLVFAGGTCVYNPEPIADFIDLAVIGEGEQADAELTKLYAQAKNEGWSKKEFLIRAAKLPGIYVPSLYTFKYKNDGTIESIAPHDGAPEIVTKRIVQDLDSTYFPVSGIVPSTEIVHDRAVLELFRGCIRGCRFCQAGYVYRPVRKKKYETLVKQGIDSLESSGYEEIGLSSLSTSDYKELDKLCDGLLEWCEPRKISLSLPSLRADNFSMELMEKVQKVRKSGLTFAPEAGSQRLRDVINKNVTEEDILNCCRIAFEGGWNGVKLYFMMGLPTETDEDIIAISDLAFKVLNTWKQYAANKNRGVRITVSTSCFVPKPMTPFQWEAQDSIDEFRRKQQLLKDNMRSKAISYNWHDPVVSFIEAVLALGDRRLCPVLQCVFRHSGGLAAWEEFFSEDAWTQAFKENNIDPHFYANRERSDDEILPWSIISDGVSADHLKRERELSRLAVTTPDCRSKCSSCGARKLSTEGRCDE